MSNTNSCILAVDAGGTFLKAALVQYEDPAGSCTILENSFIKIPIHSEGTLEDIRESYIQLASRGVVEATARGLTMAGIGVSIPGPFDYAGGKCLMKHKYSSIYGVPMRPWFEKSAGAVPISFVHDSSAFILGATSNRKYEGFNRIGAVIVGTGLGFATMMDNKIFTNPQGGPGISIFSRPYRDSTAEEYVSRRAIISHYKKLRPDSPADMDVYDIFKLAFSGQTEAIKVFNDTGLYLSEILHDILYENRFECLLLGGAISKPPNLFLPPLQQGLSDISSLTLIEVAEDIDNAPLLGAARFLLLSLPN